MSGASPVKTITSSTLIELPTGQAHLVDDAADGLRRCAHAFADNIGTIVRAEKILGDWTGEAKMSCAAQCDTQREKVNLFRHASTHAATALRQYADALRTHKLAIKSLDAQAKEAMDTIRRADKLADEAREEATKAGDKALEAVASTRPDAPREVQKWGDTAAAKTAEAGRHARTANGATTELDRLRRKAKQHLNEIEEAADAATSKLRAVMNTLPTTSYQDITGVGELVLLSKAVETKAGITIFTIHIGAGHTVITETLANKEVKVTLMDTVEAGLDLTAGGKLKAGTADGAKGGLSPSVALTLMAALSSGKTFKFKNAKEAQKFVDDATHKNMEELAGDLFALDDYDADPIETFTKGGVDVELSVDGGKGISASAGAGAAVATKEDTKSGDITSIYEVYAKAGADLDLLTVGASASAKGTSALAVTRDKAGKVTKLQISNAVETSAEVNVKSGDLKDLTKQIKEAGAEVKSGNTKLVQTDVELDVNDRNRALVDHYLESGAIDTHAAKNLAQELDHSGQINVNVYERQIDGFEIIAKGEGFGINASHTTTTDGLLSSKRKPPGDPEYHRIPVPAR